MREKFWKNDVKYYIALQVLYILDSIMKKDVDKWNYVKLGKLKDIDVRMLLSIQKISDNVGDLIEKLLRES
ncbi:MAG: hypothetical protein QXZ23_03355 [Saccharolobus sp.]